MTVKSRTRPLALVGYNDEWMSRSIESIFDQRGYDVTRVETGRDALQRARRERYDVLMLDERIRDLDAIEVCIALRDDPLFDHSTPIVVTSASHATPQTRISAYAAGAWEYCAQPLDVEALFLKLTTFLRARRQLEVAQSRSLMDPASGLYTEFGLHQLAGQLEARAQRSHEAFACVAFSTPKEDGKPERTGGPRRDRSVFRDVAGLLRDQSRKSDVVAQVGDSRVAILAPNTDAAGARLMVARLQRELDTVSANHTAGKRVDLRAGYCAVSDFSAADVDIMGLVHRAETALDRTTSTVDGDVIVDFDDPP